MSEKIKKTTTKALANVADDETLATLSESFPVEPGVNRILLPRLGMVSQDQVEGKGKSMKVVTEAGTFFIEKQTDEVDEDGKKKWEREEIGTSIRGLILFQRKQLRMYDEKTELFTSSPIYDSEEEVVPLFCDKNEVGRGTPKELKEKYQYTDKEGKVKSKLEDNRILYVEVDDTIYQLNLRGSSMYAFMTYSRKVSPPTVITEFSSEAKEKGSIEWNQMTFTPVRKLTQKEAEAAVNKIKEIKTAIVLEKSQYNNQVDVEVIKRSKEADKELEDF